MDLIKILGWQAELQRPEYSDLYNALRQAQEITPAAFESKARANASGLNDDVQIRALSMQEGTASVSFSSGYGKRMPVICTYCAIEGSSGEPYGETLAVSFDSHSLSSVYTLDRQFSNRETATAHVVFCYIDDEGMCYYTEKHLSAQYMAQPAIINPQVSEPKSSDGEKTYVSYARTPQFQDIHFDYDYPDNRRVPEGVKILLPFVGSFQVTDEWTILGVETEVEPLPHLCLQFLTGGGTATYNQDIASKIVIDHETNTVSWNFAQNSGDDDWHAYAPPTAFGAQTLTELYGRFAIKLQNINDPTQYYVPVFTVESRPPDARAKCTEVAVKQIHIYLGCFAKGTRIRMADGSQKPIESMQLGDLVALEDGVGMLRDLIRGMEDTLIRVETASNSLLVTDSHPLKTTRGYVRAEDLTCADCVIVDGQEAQIEHLYPQPYHDDVYNLILDKPSAVYANGFLAADFTMENDLWIESHPCGRYLASNKVVEQFQMLYDTITEQSEFQMIYDTFKRQSR